MIKIRGAVLVLLACALLVRTLEMSVDFLPEIPFGVTAVGVSDVLALAALVALLKHERFTLDRKAKLAAVALIATMVVVAAAFVVTTGIAPTISVFMVGVSEEIVYRLAAPLLIALLLQRVGMAWRYALPIAILLGALWFMALPGHVAQFQTWFSPLVFVFFALLMSRVVWRGGALWPAIAAHIGIDIVTMMTNIGAAPQVFRLVATAILLLSLAPIIDALAKTRPAMREGVVVIDEDETVIDLREAQPLGGEASGVDRRVAV